MKFPSGNDRAESAQVRDGFLRHQIAVAISNQAKYPSFYRCLGSKKWNEEKQFRTGTFVPEGLTFSPGILTAIGSITPDHRDPFETATQS
jgi:hypothetical protein